MALSEADIQREQDDLGLRFPAALIGRLRRQNGGYVEKYERSWTLFPIWDTSDKRMLKKTFLSIARETRAAREFRRLPSNAIAIGAADDGAVLALLADATGQVSPTLYEWDRHEGRMKLLADHLFELWESDEG